MAQLAARLCVLSVPTTLAYLPNCPISRSLRTRPYKGLGGSRRDRHLSGEWGGDRPTFYLMVVELDTRTGLTGGPRRAGGSLGHRTSSGPHCWAKQVLLGQNVVQQVRG